MFITPQSRSTNAAAAELSGEAILSRPPPPRLQQEVPEARVPRLRDPPAVARALGNAGRLQADGGSHRRRSTFDRAAGPRADNLAAKGNRQPRAPRRACSHGFPAPARPPALRGRGPGPRSRRWGVQLTDGPSDGACKAYLGSFLTTNDFKPLRAAPGRSNIQGRTPSFREGTRTTGPNSFKIRKRPMATWCRWGRWPTCATSAGPVPDHPGTNMFPGGGRSMAPRLARGQPPAMSWRRWKKLARELPRNMTSEVVRAELLAEAVQQGSRQFRRTCNRNPFSALRPRGSCWSSSCWAGLYESWSLPWAVILVVPMLSARARWQAIALLAGMDVNIFRSGRVRGAGRAGRQERRS